VRPKAGDAYDEVPAVRELRRFLADPERQVQLLLADG
jgi:hypothetical protein